jgi:hypothetical protein
MGRGTLVLFALFAQVFDKVICSGIHIELSPRLKINHHPCEAETLRV